MITEVQLNETLDSRLQIEGVISRSGMASIYKAKDLMTGQAVAVKIPYQQFESDPASFARFQREAEIGKKLSHPNILRLLDVGEHSRSYIVMDSRITGDQIAPRNLNREIPKEIEKIILHAMEREPHRRYASATAMKAELDNLKLTGRHQHLQSVQGWKMRWQGSKLIILSALLPVLVFLIGFILVRCHGAPH